MSILRALHRRQMLAVGVAILATGVSLPSAWFLVPRSKFKAQAVLQVAAQPPQVLFKTLETQGNGGDEYKRYQKTQIGLLKSRFVLNAALQQEGISKYRILRANVEPSKWLAEKLEVAFVGESELMEIALSGDDPEELAGVVNAIKKAYMEEVVNVENKRRMARYDTLKTLQKQYADIMKGRRETLKSLAETVGSDDRKTLSMQQQFAMEHLAAVRKELLDVQSQKRKVESLLQMRRPEENRDEPPLEQPVPEADIRRMIDQEPGVATLAAKLASAEEQLSSEGAHIKSVARKGASDPAYKRLTDYINVTRKSLANRRAAVRPLVIRKLQEEGKTDQVTRGDESEQQLAMLQDLEKRLNQDINTLSAGNHSLTKSTLGLQEIQDELAQLQEAATKIGSEVEALNVELGAPPRIRVVEHAVVPRGRDELKRYTMIGMISVGSFFAGLFGIAFLELQSRKVESADDVPNELGLRVVGALPILPARPSRGKMVEGKEEQHTQWQALLLESIDATRTLLLHAARTDSHRVVMIASAVPGEGKTSLAGHLATSLARSGLRTLLIDADLRRPALHRVFDRPLAAGLSELLRGEVSAADVIGETAIDELKLITAGKCDQRTIRSLSQGSLGALFRELKEQFDFVIVDSSPILPVADAMIIAQQADAVLFSIFREVSRKHKVSAAVQRLECLGVSILGAVVTGTHGGMFGNEYDRSYAYSSSSEYSATNSSESGT